MTTSYPSEKSLALALPLLCVIAGCCCQAVPLPGERHCPTDARRLYCTWGEEAVRRCPCGPDREFYGLKPTEWRSWPEGWRCNDGQWDVPISAPESAYAESSGVSPAENESVVALNPELGKKVVNPFGNAAEPQLSIAGHSPIGKAAEPPAASPPVAPTTPADAPSTVPAFEPTPLLRLPDMSKALPEIHAPGTSEAQIPPVPTKIEEPPARSVPHVDPNLSDRVQQHLLNSLTL